MAENVTGDDLGGRRSSGEVETEATGHDEARGVVLRAPASALSALVIMVWLVGGRSHVGDELGGGGYSVSVVRCTRCRRELVERGRTELGSRRLQQASKRARGRPELSGAMMTISVAGVGGDGVSGDSRAGKRSGLSLLDVVDDGGASGHGDAAWGQRRTRLSRWRGRGGVIHGAGERGRGAREERACLRARGRNG